MEKLSVIDRASFVPFLAVIPRAPPGTRRVISLIGMKGTDGVNVNAAPFLRQEPPVVGDRVGIGELDASGEENTMVIGALAETSTVASLGSRRSTWSDAFVDDRVD